MAIDPATAALALQGVSLLGNLGSSLLGRNDQRDALRKAEEENRRRIAQGNLSRAFGGNPAVDLVQPKLKQGLGTKILGGVGTAAGIGSQALGLFNQARALQAKTAGTGLANQNLIDEAAIKRGALEAGAISDTDIGDIGTVRSGPSQIGARAPKLSAGPGDIGAAGLSRQAPQGAPQQIPSLGAAGQIGAQSPPQVVPQQPLSIRGNSPMGLPQGGLPEQSIAARSYKDPGKVNIDMMPGVLPEHNGNPTSMGMDSFVNGFLTGNDPDPAKNNIEMMSVDARGNPRSVFHKLDPATGQTIDAQAPGSDIAGMLRGSDIGARGQSSETPILPQTPTPRTGDIGARAPQAPPTSTVGLPEPSSLLSELGNLSFQGAVQKRRTGLEASERAIGRQGLQDEFINSQINLNNAKAFGERQPTGPTSGSVAAGKAKFDQLSGIVSGSATRGLSWKDATSNPAFASVGDFEVAALRESYDSTNYAKAAETNENVAGFLFGDLKSKYNMGVLKKASDLSFGMNLMATGYERQNSIGDLAMIQATVRLSDPGLGVRPSEAEQAEKTQGILDIYAPGMTLQRLRAGDKFSPEHRTRMLEAAEGLYEGQIELIDNALEDEYDAAIRSVRGFGGTEDDLLRFNRTYALEPLSTYNYKKRLPMFDFSGGGGNRSTDTLGGN